MKTPMTPTYSLIEVVTIDPKLLKKIDAEWLDWSLEIGPKKVQTEQFGLKLDSIRFRNYKSSDEFDDSESFLLELLFYKYCPDLNEFGPDVNQYLGGRQPPVYMKRKGFMSGLVPTIYPCIELVVVSSAAYYMDVKMILELLKISWKKIMQREICLENMEKCNFTKAQEHKAMGHEQYKMQPNN